MSRVHGLAVCALFGCSSTGSGGSEGGTSSGAVDEPATTSSDSDGEVAPLCVGGGPLTIGDATWAKAPFQPPGDMGEPSDDGYPGDPSGGGFVQDPDGNSTSIECSVWDQDCPRGEKCMPWSNDGMKDWNASRCSPVAPMPGAPYDACTVEGSAWSGIDDCELGSMCWNVVENEGTCIPLCQGSEAMPECPEGTWCWIGNEGTTIVCLPDEICADDDVCQCMCPDVADPDCTEGQCDGMSASTQPPAITAPPRVVEGEPAMCPDTEEPVVLYMSNDDSNSQASPILARAAIREGQVVPPDRVRIHEFLNYYHLSYDNPTDVAARVGIQMRRTDADLGEFTLMVSARGKQVDAADRPPLNLVFSLDTSGSMSGHPIEMLQETIVAVAGSLRAGDVVSAVTWDTEQEVLLDGYVVGGPDDPEVLALASSVAADGGTDLHAGLVKAYQLANAHKIDDGINRVMLVSDGGANVGITDSDLIASESQGADGEGVYLLGVGVGEASGYSDALMDAVTDAGKGAYLFVDEAAEAERMFGSEFLANMTVVARNVRLKLTLPWYFGIKAFHGEEYSGDPAEVEPQHLAPNDAMTFHQIIAACDPSYITTCDSVTARVDYVDPITGEEGYDERSIAFADLVVEDEAMLRKSDAIVGYAKGLIVIGWLWENDQHAEAAAVAANMQAWVGAAATELGDAELGAIADLLGEYQAVLAAG